MDSSGADGKLDLATAFLRYRKVLSVAAERAAGYEFDGEDLLQDTFVFLLEKGCTSVPARDAEAYLKVAVRRRAWRARIRARRCVAFEPYRLCTIADARTSSSALDDAVIRRLVIDQYVALLSPAQQAVIGLWRDGFEPLQIAHELGVSASSVKTHVARALARLVRLGNAERERERERAGV
jgi:RNA polymerase sigma factor (sigma-70 family)